MKVEKMEPNNYVLGSKVRKILSVYKDGKEIKDLEILKYSPNDLIDHLERQFTDGMTWENYGKWHVDHIQPISSFNINEIGDEEFIKCWSLKNLQPLWGEDNIRKSNKIIN
jgi:hypothetical protein